MRIFFGKAEGCMYVDMIADATRDVHPRRVLAFVVVAKCHGCWESRRAAPCALLPLEPHEVN